MKKLHGYHGSKEKFDSFSLDNVRLNGADHGVGIYLTDSFSLAESYAKEGYIYEVVASVNESFSIDELTITRSQLKEVIKILQDNDKDFLSNYDDVDMVGFDNVLEYAVSLEYDSSSSDVDLVSGIGNVYGGFTEVNQAFKDVCGFDYVEALEAGGNQEDFFVIMNPISISIVNVYDNHKILSESEVSAIIFDIVDNIISDKYFGHSSISQQTLYSYFKIFTNTFGNATSEDLYNGFVDYFVDTNRSDVWCEMIDGIKPEFDTAIENLKSDDTLHGWSFVELGHIESGILWKNYITRYIPNITEQELAEMLEVWSEENDVEYNLV